MRVTAVVLRQNIGTQFKLFWMSQARRRVQEDGTAAMLEERGHTVLDPKDLLSPPYPRQPQVELPPRLEESLAPPPPEEQDTQCFVFTKFFSPIMGIQQVQSLTNTVVRRSLPQRVLEQATPSTPEQDHRVKEAILHAHLLDSYQERLPRIYDVINRPGWVAKREYGIPLKRKNKTLTYQLLLLLDQLVGGIDRQLVEDASTKVMLNYADRLLRLEHKAAFLLSSPQPLPPVAGPQEVQEVAETERLPDIYPISPFSNCWPRTTYSLTEHYGVMSPELSPHTVFMHHNQPRMPHLEDHFSGMSLLYAFSHAAAYAKLVRKVDPRGDLDKPVVVQVVHANRCHYHLGVLQLNTLDLAPSPAQPARRNIFWTQEWETLFDSCSFKVAHPVLEGYNPKVFSLLKGLHAQE